MGVLYSNGLWGLKGIGSVIETERGGVRFLVSCPKMVSFSSSESDVPTHGPPAWR